ncbi:MAG: acetyl-CoA carboxylase biotin carboxyl carrier protein [Flavobacteriales bacterium]|nr:acetyl-CoA carboxylase biotin carboxyl carrier protein [Flavobacteriales bacterium]MCZ2444372.1 acetyl-CoA carboxylase biotin carboxyl carrier protein [Flavobacteriales bacterium]
MNLEDVHALIEFVAKVGVSEVDLEAQGVKIVIKTAQGATIQTMLPPVQMAAPQIIATSAPVADSPKSATPTTPSAETSSTDESKYITINSPMIGTFYRKSSPDKPVFVNVGDSISPGKVLCIIEAMKLFNEIEAEITGKIVKVMVDDASPVEYDQPLFLVDPS